MKQTHPLLCLVFYFLLNGTIFAQAPIRIDLNGRWQFRREGATKWSDAKVPGSVHMDLLSSGIITDPFYGINENNLQWIGETSWEYMRTFLVPDSLFKEKHILLTFEGLDTYARVYLNDSLIFTADNMFRSYNTEVKYILRIGANQIRIQFPPVTDENAARYGRLKHRLPGDEKMVCRKAAYQFGWDFSPTFLTCGIWRPVYLETRNYLNLYTVRYIQKEITDSVAHMAAVFTIMSDLPDSSLFVISTKDQVLFSNRESVGKGLNNIRVDFDIKNPKRWWTNGLGEPNLYTLNHEITFAGRYKLNGSTRIGLRTLELVQKDDLAGKSFYFKLNGIPVFMKGANYVPQDNFLTRVKDSSYRALIKNAVDAHMNMLRVWGGGIYENNIFYDLCDENGILVWQDFMFANGMYPGDKDFLSNVRAEAGQTIIRLRNHPSLALWCGNNEIDEGWKNWGWMKQYNFSKEDSIEMWNNYRVLFWSLLPGSVTLFDSLRPYISTTPLIGWGHPESLNMGDSHYWGVWWGKEPFSNYKTKVGRFMTEYGFQGFPTYSGIRKAITGHQLNMASPLVKFHDKHPQGLEIIDEYLKRDYKTPKDVHMYDYVSQLMQAEGMKIAIEAHRSAKPYCMGSLFWQFNDCWPGITWSAIDHSGGKKALYFYLKKEFAPFLVSPDFHNGKVTVSVVSDILENKQADLHLKIIDFSGKLLWTKSSLVNIPANSSKVYFDTTLSRLIPRLNLQYSVLVAELISGNDTLSKNLLYFDIPKNLKLDSCIIDRKYTEIPEGYSIELTTDKLAKAVYLYSTFIVGEVSDNFFDMLPGETKKIVFRTTTKNPNFTSFLWINTLYSACLKN
ncbi:MAG: glycoside hydrolase family 2 protein [Bacteroidetes bacterium]|nr:glycoside hydrolase family 2 protein [Bacteroidota bacterium]